MVATGIDFIAPARDVLHLRFHTPRHPLIGESPIKSAALAIGINVALSHSQAAFFNNMNRPSGILATDAALTREQMASLRAAFEDQAAGMAQGRIPILGGGLKFSPISISSQDAELVQAQRMSIEDICRVFGVPPPLVGDLSHATLNNSETLISNFLAMSLGSYLEHIERAFDRLFGLAGNDYVELDVAALLRTDFAGRIEGLTKAVQGGLFTPNEARSREGVGPIEGGDTAYLQRQMIPIDKIGELLEAEAAAKNAPPEPPNQQAAPEPVDTPQPEKDLDTEVVKAMYAHRRSIKKAAA
jgi:HK97 family phage portal protein